MPNHQKSIALEEERDSIVFLHEPTKQKGEVFVAGGIVAFVLTLALTHFIMGIYLAAVPGALALIFLSVGTIRARNRRSGRNLPAGIALLFVGFCVLVVVGFQAAQLSYREAIVTLRSTSVPPGPGVWGRAVITWFLPMLFVAPGLARWTNWGPKRRLVWCLISFLVPLAIFFVHQFLFSIGGAITA